MSLRQAAVRGTVVVLAAKILSVFLAQVSAIALPLVLAPDDFGIYGITFFFVGVLVLVGDFGFGTELIRRSESIEEALRTAFALRIVIGVLLEVVAVGLAYLGTGLYNDQRLFLPIIIASVAVLVNGFSLVPRTLALRSLDFKRAVVPDQFGKIALAIAALLLAFSGFGYWSLVISSLVGPAVAAVAYKYYVPWRARPAIDRRIARGLVNFGKFVTGTAMATFMAASIDKLMIGYVLGLGQLGYYLVAYSWAVGVPTAVESVMSGVTYPIFGAIQNQPARIRKAFSESLRLFSYIGVFIGSGIVALSEPFVMTVLGSRWAAAIVPMQILSVAGFCLGWISICGDLLTASGKPRQTTGISVLGVVLVGVTLYPAVIVLGLIGAAVAASLTLAVLAVLSRLLANRELGGSLSRESREELLLPMVSGLFGAASSWLVGIAISTSSFGAGAAPWLNLIARLIVYVAVYAALMQVVTRRRFLSEMRTIAKIALESRSR